MLKEPSGTKAAATAIPTWSNFRGIYVCKYRICKDLMFDDYLRSLLRTGAGNHPFYNGAGEYDTEDTPIFVENTALNTTVEDSPAAEESCYNADDYDRCNPTEWSSTTGGDEDEPLLLASPIQTSVVMAHCPDGLRVIAAAIHVLCSAIKLRNNADEDLKEPTIETIQAMRELCHSEVLMVCTSRKQIQMTPGQAIAILLPVIEALYSRQNKNRHTPCSVSSNQLSTLPLDRSGNLLLGSCGVCHVRRN